MAALVQTIPQQSSTVSVLQTRPSSSSGSFAPSPQPSQQQTSRNSTMSWNSYNTVSGSQGYRAGHQVVAPYAFTGTPSLPNSNFNSMQNRQSWTPHLRTENRTSSAPSVPQGTPVHPHAVGSNPRFSHHPAAGSVSTSSSNSSVQSYRSKDDSAIPSRQSRSDPPLRPLSTANLPSPSSSFMNISSPTVARPSPDRYRRGSRRLDNAAGAQSTVTASSLPGEDQLASKNALQEPSRKPGHARVSSVDDTARPEKPQAELAKRYRRRSWGNIDNAGLINLQLHLPSSPTPILNVHDYFDPNHRPQSAQSHRDVSGSNHSANSSTSSVREAGLTEAAPSNKSTNKLDDTKRSTKPSPLSQPVSAEPTPTGSQSPNEKQSPIPTESVASQRLADITKNELKRPGKSRLRRAFSFGSASELLKASSQNNPAKREAIAAEKSRRELLKEELGPEQAAIAEQQEASGLGESIYSHHQGRFFNSSTDNLSVSSTASSASIMLRKMGKGMKRSTRSLVGLFRPKSIVSISSNDGGNVEPMAPKLSVVNVEAERKSVTANADPQDLPRGGTVFPKMESSTQNPSAQEDVGAERSQSRKSIVGGDRERAEVLAAVRKGILKKTNSDPAVTTRSNRAAEGSQTLAGSDSPHSSAPSTPEDPSRAGNRRSEAVRIAGEDYFLSDGRIPESRSSPATPQPVATKTLVFSPRIQFHETWPSGEYDRRGDIATCNRLTPLLAQQIKEELNNFKMEMEVHETSKIYTHFL
ncbi:hypothetical protein ALT_7631 [Aspergillus lentulus]|uniref:Protein BNI4 n=1 Tax=Aspergillus lentulus TaxID=293939 RepID=A0AAN4TDY3_ASPLE|nr:hypothetical protein ALT_7631 [Aspergillus lentulus]GFF58434.1 hypothetical protein IFM62136_03797 [Aspergillus lentulus]GFF76036.1 hypothetical protein IFM60648_04600 [Aspergillus lentulus]GFF78902.1 hypothetical protein IFM47457_04778 [Aspergillus lentulus]GFG04113.1 hypothetical protein IFM61392_03155 [Aspergillus lentulus]